MKKLRLFVAMLILGCVLTLTSCGETAGKYVTEIKQSGNTVTIVYSDGTEQSIEVESQKGDKGDKGDTGEKGESGTPAEEIEFRYYRGSLWWKYESSTTWIELVSSNELDAEDLEISDFNMSVFAKDEDLSLTISSSLVVNGNYTNYEIIGNTLTFSVGENDSKKYYDISKVDENYELITYNKSGVNEQKVSYVNNKDAKQFNGTFTYKTSDDSSYKVVINANEYGVNTNMTDGENTVYCNTYLKGEVLYAKQSFGGDAELTLEQKVTGYVATLKLADGTTKEVTSVTKWVDIANFKEGYTIDIDAENKVDILINSASNIKFYSSATDTKDYWGTGISQNETSITLTTEDENKYEFIWDETEEAVMVKVNGQVKPYTTWTDVTTFAGNATFKNNDESITFTISVSITSYGTNVMVNSSLEGTWWIAKQYRNSLLISSTNYETNVTTIYVLTLNSDGTFSGTCGDKSYIIVREYTAADFVGKYQCQQNADSGTISFEITYNSLTDQYVLEFMGNPLNYNIDGNKLIFKNSRQGVQYELIKNSDSTYSFQEKYYELSDAEYVVYLSVTRTDN